MISQIDEVTVARVWLRLQGFHYKASLTRVSLTRVSLSRFHLRGFHLQCSTYIDEVAVSRVWEANWDDCSAVHIHLNTAGLIGWS